MLKRLIANLKHPQIRIIRRCNMDNSMDIIQTHLLGSYIIRNYHYKSKQPSI